MRGSHPQIALAPTIRRPAHNVRARCREGWHTLSLRQILTKNVTRETGSGNHGQLQTFTHMSIVHTEFERLVLWSINK